MKHMVEEQQKVLPVTILLTSYNRKELLKKTITLINSRTFFPFRIIVIDNASTDGSQGLLKEMKVHGKIWDYVCMPENVGQCKALGKGFDVVEEWENNKERMHRPSNDFIVTTQDDIYPPMLGQDNCWLTQMINLLEKNESEYGGLCQRIQRTSRTDIDESKDIIPGFKNFPSVFRLMRRSDLRKIEGNKFGNLRKWESNVTGENYKNIIRKKFGFTTHIYADHSGFMLENKGFPDGTDTFTVADNKKDERFHKPYPDIDPLTNVPININHGCDKAEQDKRDEYNKGEKAEVTNIILTCNRPDGLKRIVESVRRTTKDIKNDILVVADSNDQEAYNYCLAADVKCILSSFHRDFGAQANLATYACETKYFTILSDDQEFIEDGWLSRALDIFKNKFVDGVGLMPFNENIQKGRIFTVGMSSKNFIDAMHGNMYYPGYKHYKGDREITEIAKELELYHYDDSIKIEHYHFSKGADKDETYQNSENKFLKLDRALKNDRDANVDKLIGLNHYKF